MRSLRFVDLFAGLGGFHEALAKLGHQCVFASEIDEELRALYSRNYPSAKKCTFGDIREYKDRVPNHDMLCAGFPCQPFSKSGSQLGRRDKTRGTLFDEILYILDKCKPEYVLLENVGNFERHDDGRTWKIIKKRLRARGYDVQGTEHISCGGPGLISPHHLGFPQSRERFFVVARLGKALKNPFPIVDRQFNPTIRDIVQSDGQLSTRDLAETRLTEQQKACVNHWNSLLKALPENEVDLPSFPIWGDEIGATYPYENCTPYGAPLGELRRCLNGSCSHAALNREDLLSLLPSYARTEEAEFPTWKIQFIKKNRQWFLDCKDYIPKHWVDHLQSFPASLRKLEWNCKGEERDLWRHILQFRPSGLRAKRYTTVPALVAMTSTQIPILGPQRRFLSRIEALRLQGFPDSHALPNSRDRAFKALGNAVHAGVVEAIAKQLLSD